MKLGSLEVEPIDFRPCDTCAAMAVLSVDGQPQCPEHIGTRLQADPAALGDLTALVVSTHERL